MSVNDIVTSGAKPLFFLDYFATSHLDVDLAEKVRLATYIYLTSWRFHSLIQTGVLSPFPVKQSWLLTFMQVIKGIVDGCQQSDCALLGGEVPITPCFFSKITPSKKTHILQQKHYI